MYTVNWDLAPKATHYLPPLDNSGAYNPVYWKLVGGVALVAWADDLRAPGNLTRIDNPLLTDESRARLIPRPAEDAPAIDWSEATAGTTHWTPYEGAVCPFLRRDGDDWLWWVGDLLLWRPFSERDSNWKRQLQGVIARPVEPGRAAAEVAEQAPPAWDGSGLPPVGVNCWHKLGMEFDSPLEEVTIIAHTKANGAAVAVFQRGDVVSFSEGRFFRPIPTPEQIAAKTREEGIAQILADYQHTVGPATHLLTREQAARLYDIGYRKQETQA